MIEREEDIFQFWVKHPFAGKTLKTAGGKTLRILSPGILNTDSGPDFFDARIEIDGQTWIGNIEVHVKASDWNRHGHTGDKAYSNVVLHVVYEHDADIRDEHGNLLPVMVITDKMILAHRRKQKNLEPEGVRPLKTLKTIGMVKSLEDYGVQRLDRRSNELSTELAHLNGDMEALFQRHLFRRFGMRTNPDPFQQLAHSVPGKIIRRQKNNITDIEALLFGQSGLLPSIPVDAYSADLLYRYVGLKQKYALVPMHEFSWKFMRMRPSNFPTIRISQLAVLLHSTHNLYRKCAGDADLAELKEIFNINATSYWDDHFRFGISSGKFVKHFGDEAVHSVLINAVAMLRYFLGVHLNDRALKENALQLLRDLPSEENKLIRDSGKTPVNALESQGVLEFLTGKSESNDGGLICSECHFPYFSKAIQHDREQTNRQDRLVVRGPRVRRLRLVG